METSENTNRFEPILLLEKWIASGMGSTIDNEILSYACLLVSGAMIDHDYETLTELKNRLTPMAAGISRRLQSLNIPIAEIQAGGIPVMSSLVRAAFQYLEWNDPVSTLKHIRYGKELLSILIENSLKNNPDKNESFVLNLPLIEKTLAKNKINLSQATISRCLKLLEQKAFIHLTGSTRSRKCHILHKTWQLYEQEKAYKEDSMGQGTGDPPINWTDPPLPIYQEEDASTIAPETLLPLKNPTLKNVGVDFDFAYQLDQYKGESAQCAA